MQVRASNVTDTKLCNNDKKYDCCQLLAAAVIATAAAVGGRVVMLNLNMPPLG
jgi:hypothetical protein